MPRTPRQPIDPRTLTILFVLLSFGISVAILAKRNLYDDEITSIPVFTSSVQSIIRYTSSADVHPPGMYLLAHFAWRLIPSFRWMNLFPIAFVCAGLAIFLLPIVPLFPTTRSRVCVLLLTTLHPQLLLWASTMRWYSWWTAVALIAIIVALQPQATPPWLSRRRAVALGALLAALLYINYVAILLAFSLIPAMWLRYRKQPRKSLVAHALVAVLVCSALVAPQLHAFFSVHLRNGGLQRYGLVESFARLLQSLITSEAYLPWHPVAIVAVILFAVLGAAAVYAALRHRQAVFETPPVLPSLAILAGSFFLLVGGIGFGGKPRNGLLLIPLLGPLVGCVFANLRTRLQAAILIFLPIFTGFGVAHMIGRYGLTKTMMTDHPGPVVQFVRRTSGTRCSLVFTYDPLLQFALSQSGIEHLQVFSPYLDHSSLNVEGCSSAFLYTVRSFAGDPEWEDILNAELHSADQLMQGRPEVHQFSFDPDAARKRSLAHLPGLRRALSSGARLPDYHYIVTSGPLNPQGVQSLRSRAPEFFGGLSVPAKP